MMILNALTLFGAICVIGFFAMIVGAIVAIVFDPQKDANESTDFERSMTRWGDMFDEDKRP